MGFSIRMNLLEVRKGREAAMEEEERREKERREEE